MISTVNLHWNKDTTCVSLHIFYKLLWTLKPIFWFHTNVYLWQGNDVKDVTHHYGKLALAGNKFVMQSQGSGCYYPKYNASIFFVVITAKARQTCWIMMLFVRRDINVLKDVISKALHKCTKRYWKQKQNCFTILINIMKYCGRWDHNTISVTYSGETVNYNLE